MLFADVPYAPLLETPIVLAQAVSAATNLGSLTQIVTKKGTDFILRDCQEFTDHMDPGSAERVVDPAQGLANYLNEHYKREIDSNAIQIALLEGPKYGELTAYSGKSVGHGFYSYAPKAGFLGKDQVVFSAALGGKRYKVVMSLVVQGADQVNFSCPPEPRLIKVSTLISPLIDYKVTFSDLSGSSVGNTVGEGLFAQITLDTTAAGHGWYVDATPLDNTNDYLPTSNPNVWLAKAGTDAAGKMDMLSVLLHEYGHALGLEHSIDSGDFMTETLEAGERRLPSNEFKPGPVS